MLPTIFHNQAPMTYYSGQWKVVPLPIVVALMLASKVAIEHHFERKRSKN